MSSKRHTKLGVDRPLMTIAVNCVVTKQRNKQILWRIIKNYPSGASCLKLTTSLVNISLKFQTTYYKYVVIFC